MLDYSIEDYEIRKQIVEKYLLDNQSEIEEYFNTCHIKQTGFLSENMYMGKVLNKLTNYLLQNTTFKYKNGFSPIDTNDESNDYEVLTFKKNFRLKKEIKITKEDIDTYPVLQEYQKSIDYLTNKTKEEKTYVIRRFIKDLKQNQIDIKEVLTRPIIFKKLTGDYPIDKNKVYDIEFWRSFVPSKEKDNIYKFELDLFKDDEENTHRKNWFIVLQLLCFKSGIEINTKDKEGNIYSGFTSGISQNIDNYIKMFYEIIDLVRLTRFEEKIIEVCSKGKKDKYSLLESDNKELQKKSYFSCEEIAKEMRITPKNLNKILNRFCDKLASAFEEYFIENIYYIYLVKGTYKRCSKCGQVKLIRNFYEDKTYKDGYKNNCIQCYQENKKYCTKCNQYLNKNFFGKDKRNKDKLKSICKNCDNSQKKKY